ncbi:MAG: methyltransferase domain-containing protein [Elusimicrobia bacterium]|nr:methyltransferase domain-containing protein [Elusimicrobiota bacterium]
MIAELEPVRTLLQEYYGRRFKSRKDFKQNACCPTDTGRRHADILELIPKEVKDRHYGCGCPFPSDQLSGLTVLDLGSGTGVDVFIMAYLVGPKGFVHGIDMTEEQLVVAQAALPVVMRRFGYGRTNVAFHQDFIEVAETIPDTSVDLVISDCVINLSPRKDLVFQTIHRVLKEGGEFYISDIAADRRLPPAISQDPDLIAECLGGAEYEHDWFDQMKAARFPDPRVVSRTVVQQEVKGEPVTFSSLTVRGFKFATPLDPRCEDYGQVAVYRGNLPSSPARFTFDDHHVFEVHRPVPVCRNTARMLQETRLSRYFEVTTAIKHFGLFKCGPSPVVTSVNGACC